MIKKAIVPIINVCKDCRKNDDGKCRGVGNEVICSIIEEGKQDYVETKVIELPETFEEFKSLCKVLSEKHELLKHGSDIQIYHDSVWIKPLEYTRTGEIMMHIIEDDYEVTYEISTGRTPTQMYLNILTAKDNIIGGV